MKRVILTVAIITALGGAIGFGVYVNRKPATLPADATVAFGAEPSIEPGQPKNPDRPATPSAARVRVKETSPSPSAPADASSVAAKDLQPDLGQTIDALLSPRLDFDEKQAIWKQLRKSGRLDPVVAALEQRTASEAQPSADDMAALGQAYFQKCAASDDIREQAILIMKADQAFDAALNIDPSNWEARYTKAVGMSHWPADLNKGNDVVEQFRNLIQQQESQAPQPNFARSYVRLGDQYEKMGQAAYAAQVWQRGAALFPNDDDLKKKLATPPAAQ